jgi:hypothetical protein
MKTNTLISLICYFIVCILIVLIFIPSLGYILPGIIAVAAIIAILEVIRKKLNDWLNNNDNEENIKPGSAAA